MGEERSASSLSSGNHRSRIPRLARSASMREKRTSRKSFEREVIRSTRGNHAKNSTEATNPQLFRSASFATSRGLSGVSTASSTPRQTAVTGRTQSICNDPAATRNSSSLRSPPYVSPYSKRNFTRERKTQLTLTEQNLKLCSYDLSQKEGPDDDEDSEKSFDSPRSSASCDVGVFSRMSMWGTPHRMQNVLHCRHTHGNPDEYLTPTQRAARKIRELKTELKEARRDIAQRDGRISSLTKELVELRISTAKERSTPDSPDTTHFPRSSSSLSKSTDRDTGKRWKEESVRRKTSFKAFETRAESSLCGTPPSDESEPELRVLKDPSAKGSPSVKEASFVPSPISFSFEDSESCDLSRSLADSGHYEGVPSPSLSAKDSLDSGRSAVRRFVRTLCTEDDSRESSMVWTAIEAAENRVRSDYEKKFDELQRNQMNEYHELKEKHNDHVETLLAKLSEANLRYFEMRPLHEKAQGRIRELEKENKRLKDDLEESEAKHQKVYLQMYLKGQEAARIEADRENAGKSPPNSVSERSSQEKTDGAESAFKEKVLNDNSIMSGLMKQLSDSEEEIIKLKAMYHHELARAKRHSRGCFSERRDEIDPEITLQFLKSAIYYFLTDKDNSKGHLRAIESILGYSSTERVNIGRYVNI